ncbi:hypothetical protein QBC42DRAFT_288279 [Cladorrhinum samala]|uniref:Uncharacterized protein n=1 Tax=Cladorrhinum samala TaxID=585594 RepID=A0AAV9HIU3_9PEZI|nr:hypothetical protein QBC42DRAFT_288279 [Cladorrhinum samala]
MLFYTIWDLFELAFVWFFYVETKGPTLEDIARIFDGDGAVAHIDMHEVQKDIYQNAPDRFGDEDDRLPGRAL